MGKKKKPQIQKQVNPLKLFKGHIGIVEYASKLKILYGLNQANMYNDPELTPLCVAVTVPGIKHADSIKQIHGNLAFEITPEEICAICGVCDEEQLLAMLELAMQKQMIHMLAIDSSNLSKEEKRELGQVPFPDIAKK